MKRVFDIICSFLLLIILSPVFLLIACAVYFTSPGPVLFRSVRTGYKGKNFTIFKFRTMKDGSGRPNDFILKGDPRVTTIGKFLRSTHLDELPQLWNVLRGEMSMVGPRPYEAKDVANLRKLLKRYDERFEVYPGITGLVQIKGRLIKKRGSRMILAVELYYIKRQNFWLDLYIILKTIIVVLKRKGI